MLRDSAVKFLTSRYDFEAHRKISAEANGFSLAIWKEMAELGWLGLPFPEAVGGFGGGAADIGILMETFGRSLVLEPYVEIGRAHV